MFRNDDAQCRLRPAMSFEKIVDPLKVVRLEGGFVHDGEEWLFYFANFRRMSLR
jgi:hypothetical protein